MVREFDGELLIRANQGHTMKVVESDLLLETITEHSQVQECVHGTYLVHWPFIKRQGFMTLDGGFGTALGNAAQSHALWGAQLLFGLNGHTTIMAAHRQFLEAGADIISTSSYQASFETFRAAGKASKPPSLSLVARLL